MFQLLGIRAISCVALFDWRARDRSLWVKCGERVWKKHSWNKKEKSSNVVGRRTLD